MSKPRQIFERIVEKCRLKVALLACQAEIEGALAALDPAEIRELQDLMASEVAAVDEDTEAMRQRIDQEAAARREMQTRVGFAIVASV